MSKEKKKGREILGKDEGNEQYRI